MNDLSWQSWSRSSGLQNWEHLMGVSGHPETLVAKMLKTNAIIFWDHHYLLPNFVNLSFLTNFDETGHPNFQLRLKNRPFTKNLLKKLFNNWSPIELYFQDPSKFLTCLLWPKICSTVLFFWVHLAELVLGCCFYTFKIKRINIYHV